MRFPEDYYYYYIKQLSQLKRDPRFAESSIPAKIQAVGKNLDSAITAGNCNKTKRRCRGSNPGHPRDRREYLPLYYNDRCDKRDEKYSEVCQFT